VTPEQFCYWLQGFAEISGCEPNDSEWMIIKDHLKTVFEKVTPDRSEEKPKTLTGKDLQKIIQETRPGITCSLGDPPNPIGFDPWPRPTGGSGRIC